MENRKKKMIILTSIIVLILIITVALIIKLISLNKNTDDTIETNNLEEEINTTVFENNIIQGNEIEDETNNIVNENVTEEAEEIAKNEHIADPEQEVDKETMEKEVSNKEKAIKIAEKDYGKNASIYFTYEGIENGKHIVYVRDNDTHHIATYKINIDTGTFYKE